MEHIQCKDCGNDFTLKAEEVDWYTKKGFDLPRRCKPCRVKKKAQVEGGGR
jgi:hypothetical protein